MPSMHHFLMGYEDSSPEFVSSTDLASRIGISEAAAQSIKAIGRIFDVPDLSRAEDTATAFAITTTAGPVIADRAWMERNKPTAGELLASTYDGPRYFAPDGLSAAPDVCEDTLEGLVGDMVEHGGNAGAGWVARLRKLVDLELARRETFVLRMTDELAPGDLAVFRKHWDSLRSGSGRWSMPVLVSKPESAGTPAAHWRAEGKPDPHAGNYDGERAALAMGNLTDDELANAAFMNYDRSPSIEDMLAGKAFRPIVWMTAVKERIRWLSRALERAIAATPAPLPVVVMEKVEDPADRTEELLADLFARGGDKLPSKVTREALQAQIVTTTFEVRADGRTTLCEITTLNGTTERGESTPALGVEFVKETGEKYAFEQALNKLWPKEGYLLRELHFRARGSVPA